MLKEYLGKQCRDTTGVGKLAEYVAGSLFAMMVTGNLSLVSRGYPSCATELGGG